MQEDRVDSTTGTCIVMTGYRVCFIISAANGSVGTTGDRCGTNIIDERNEIGISKNY